MRPKACALVNGTVIRLLRVARAENQADLAERTGISAGEMSYLETQSRCAKPDTLAWLAQALDVPEAILTAPTATVTIRAGGAEVKLEVGL